MIHLLGVIDYNLKPIQPQYFLCKPNREIVSKLSEAFDDNLTLYINQINELNFSLPYHIDVRHQLKRNKNIKLLKEKFLIKVVTGHEIEWFIIQQLEQELGDREVLKVQCYSLSHQLTNTLIKSYEVESYHARQVMQDLLKDTTWDIGTLDADFKLTYRSFSFASTNVLEAVFAVAETYNAIVHFDTNQKKISMSKPELTGINRGLTISYGKLMKSMRKNHHAEEMVTRLSAFGKDGMGIQKINPTGQNYIESYRYWMYPFERDKNKLVLSSSYWMSDSLCQALLDYDELISSKKGLFQQYLAQLKGYEEELNTLNVELSKLKNDEVVIQEVTLAQQFGDKMFFEKYEHTASSSRTFQLNPDYAYAVMIEVKNNTGLTVSADGVATPTNSGQWVLLQKFRGKSSTSVTLSGGQSSVFIQVAMIKLSELDGTDSNVDIVNQYSLYHKLNQIQLKNIQISNKQDQITEIKELINKLQFSLSTENNFTPLQLEELNYYVIEREFSDDVYVDEQDLYEAAKQKFTELQVPQIAVDIDVVNFLEIIEEQRNWDKLRLGDFIHIQYEPLQIALTARISQISYDYEGSSIKLTLSNVKDIHDETKKIEKFLSDAKSTNIIVDTNKSKWGKAVISSNNMTKLFENFWNDVTQQINMANNEFVHIDHRGITIYDIHDPNKFVRMTHGAIGMTDNGGLLYKMAITPTHIVAENVWGKLFVGERLTLGDVDGLLEITGPKFMIFDRQGRLIQQMGLLGDKPDVFGTEVLHYATENSGDNTIINKISMTNNNGFRIERYENGDFKPIFMTTPDGDLYVRAGTDDEVFTINKQGLALGSSIWENAPFHADYKGQVWMNKLFAYEADIKNSKFTDGHIRGSDLILEDGKGGIISMFPQYGLWFGAEKAEDAPTWIKMDGTGIFNKLIVKDKDDGLMIDSEAKKIFMDNWDLVGAGMVDTELLAANLVSAEFGYISDLTANKLSTMSRSAINAYANFINIEKNNIKWITGKVMQGEQKKLSDGRPLFWLDASKTGKMTTDTTPYPVYEYILDKETTKTKMEQGFDKEGDSANPFITMGAGDGRSETSGKANLKKYNGGFKVSYNTSNSGRDMSVDFKDNGVYVNAETDKVQIQGKDFEVKAQGGKVTIADASGSTITMENGNIKIHANGKLDVNATSYNFN